MTSKLELVTRDAQRQIRELMEEREVNQTELAHMLGVTSADVSALLNPRRRISLRSIVEIAEVLNVEVTFNLS